MRIIITGILGSGGSYLAEYITRHSDAEIHGIARWHSTSREIEVPATIHECDLTDFASVLRALKISQPDIIFHLASHANVKVSFTNPLSVLNNNISGTANLLDAVRLQCPEVRLVMASTSEVYGKVSEADIPINEHCQLNPQSPYAVSKLTQDKLAQVYCEAYGMNIVRVRMFTYINPRRPDLFSTSFARQVAECEAGLRKEVLYGNLNSIRSILATDDAMNAYWIAAEKCQRGEVYNIGGTEAMTVGNFLFALIGLSSKPISARLDNKLIRPSDVTLQVPDSTKFRNATGWRPKIAVTDAIKDLLEYFRNAVREKGCDWGNGHGRFLRIQPATQRQPDGQQ